MTDRSRYGLGGGRIAILTLWLIVAIAACSDHEGDAPPTTAEDCATPGDEDGNGLADCGDPACLAFPACQPVCGNGKLEPGEACDDGNQIDGDGCDRNCRLTSCGDGAITAGEACDDGNKIDGDGCDTNCTPTGCGNGAITAGEICDDGNLVDGDGCDRNCTPTSCGNGVVTEGEICDDGNLVNGDRCDNNCTPTSCGNGIVTEGEACDDGNRVDGDGCDRNCQPTGCGNGVVTAGEACDDGNLVDGDGCNHDCTISVCGNGTRETSEACDDGNRVDGDGCDHNCTVTACGNGVVTAGEACDDGNQIDGDGCDHNCTISVCGNGIVTAGEACDDGNQIDGDGCDHDCTVTACGNGIVTAGEVCDDGNQTDGDGCDHNCTVTACGNGVATRGEDCDDGNPIDGDGCDASCHFTACPSEVPVAPGAGSSFPVAGQLTKLIADPASCFLYALDTASPSHLIVISTAAKRVLTRVTLFEDATDFAISASGAYLVISYATDAIGAIDTATWQPTIRVPTFAGPASVAVIDPGIAFYGEISSMFHRIDLRDGSGDGPGLTFLRSPQLATSRDGHLLYVGEWGTADARLIKYDVTSGAPVLVEGSAIGFDLPPKHVYVAPGGQHVYYANRQFDAASLVSIRGNTGELIYSEDVAGTFAVGANHVFDADLVRPVATLPHTATAAALTASDHELWYYSPDTGQIYYQAPQDLIGDASFGTTLRIPGSP